MLVVSDRPLTIDSTTFRAGLSFEVEDWRGAELIRAGTVRYAGPPEISYERNASEQNADGLGEEGVSCVCITKNRRRWLPKAIDCYDAQTYRPRELLIIASGEDVRDLVPERKDIRLIHIAEDRTIGGKRQYGVEQARGKYVAHWDDDDWSAPERLEEQITLLRDSGKPLAGYWSMWFTDGEHFHKFEQNMGPENYAIGTSFVYRRDFALKHPFMAVQIGEDGEFLHEVRGHGGFVSTPAEFRLVASNHKENSSPRAFRPYRPAPEGLPQACKEWMASVFN